MGTSMRDAAANIGHAGAGVAQSLGAGAKNAAGHAVDGARKGAETAGAMLSGAVDTVRSATAGIGAGVAGTADHMMHGAQSFGGAVGDAAAMAGGRVADTARDLPRRAGGTLIDARDTALGFVGNQPLVAGALGLAIGALIAAILPKTAVEDEFMGDASDAIKSALGEVAAEEIQGAKSVASDVVSEVSAAAKRGGVSPDAAAAAVHAATDKLKTAVGLADPVASEPHDAKPTETQDDDTPPDAGNS